MSGRLYALIPAHNEARTIGDVVRTTLPHVDDVIVIDDGSTDGTADAVAGLGVKIVRHEENLGKGACLTHGLDLAFSEGADAVVTLDADGQHDPADIPAFRAAAADVPGSFVLGDRSADMDNMPTGRARGIRFGNFFVSWACCRRITDAQCGMRLYPRRFWEDVRLPERQRRHFVFETAALLHAARAKLDFVKVPVAARYAGFVTRPSHYKPLVDTLRITCAVTHFLIRNGLKPRGLLIALGRTC